VSFFTKQTLRNDTKKMEEKKMRNKIKQLLKKEGGFTLIELLAVIAILGFIVAIAIPLIGNVINDAEANTDAQQEALVIDAAQMYYLQGGAADPVSTEDLQDDGYLEEKYTGADLDISKAEAEAGALAD
jgi:prepilin-type N-terminal cleavage/methylation domain-containing protein